MFGFFFPASPSFLLTYSAPMWVCHGLKGYLACRQVAIATICLKDSVLQKDMEAISSKFLCFITDYHKYHKNHHYKYTYD